MTIHNPLYLQNKGYSSREDRLLIGDIFSAEGVLSSANDLVPSLTTGLGASISAGRCYVQGDTNANQGVYRFFSDAPFTLNFTAPVTNPRIDMVVARVQDSLEVGSGPDSGTIEIVQGTPTSGANLTNLSGASALTALPTAMPIAYFHVPTSGALVGFKDLRTVSSSYETIRERAGIPNNAVVAGAGTFVLIGQSSNVAAVGNASAYRGVFYCDPADYAKGSLLTKLRLRVSYVSTVLSGQTSTFGLYPVTAVSGGSVTVGTVVPGSTVAFANPAVNTLNQGNSGDFTAPAAGHYLIAFTSGGAWTGSAEVSVAAELQVRRV